MDSYENQMFATKMGSEPKKKKTCIMDLMDIPYHLGVKQTLSLLGLKNMYNCSY